MTCSWDKKFRWYIIALMRFDYHFILAWYLSILLVVRKKRVLWFFILVHFHMKASWWVACGKNSRLAHFTLVKINIAFLVTLAMHLFTVSLLKLGHILSCSWRPSEKNDKPCHRGNSTFIENIYNRYFKIGIYSAHSDQNSELWKDKATIRCVSMKHPTTNHEF